jgi:hypothetical protein
MSEYLIQGETLTSMADKIRTLNGVEGALTTAQMDSNLGEANTEVGEQADLIAQISSALEGKAGGSGGTDTSDATATASDILSGKTAYVDGEKITGNIATKTASNLSASGKTVTIPAGYYASQVTKDVSTATQATPSITVSSSGLITASATQTAGYVAAGTKSNTKQLTTQAAQTITPSTSDKTIAAGTYCSGVQTIKGDANLIPENIVSGVSIFGVAGSAESGGSDNSSSGGSGNMNAYSLPSITLSGLFQLFYVDETNTKQNVNASSGSTIYPVNGVIATTSRPTVTTDVPYFSFNTKTGYMTYIFYGSGTVNFA